MPIFEVKIGPRFRKDLGDIESLSQSIQEFGLLHPIAVDDDRNLIAGRRRLEACKALGWDFIRVNMVPLKDLAMGEYHENVDRKDFTNSEAVAIMEAVEPVVKETMVRPRGRQPKSSNLDDLSSKTRTDEVVAKFTGKKKSTLRKGKAIVEAAQKEPEKFASISDLVDSGEISVDRGYQKVRKIQSLAEVHPDLPDLDIVTKLGYAPRPYDVWSFGSLDDRFGKPCPGNIPAGIVFNLLYFYTSKNDLVVDPMAGGGVVGDACNVLGRRCLMYDVAPIRADIVNRDLRTGLSEEARNCDLVFLDPPYWKKLEDKYDEKSISSLPRDQYLAFFKSLAKNLIDSGAKKTALLMSSYTDEADSSQNIFIWHYVSLFLEAGWTPVRHIMSPLTTQGFHPDFVKKFREERRLGRLERSLVVFGRALN